MDQSKGIQQPKLYDSATGEPLQLAETDIAKAVLSGKAAFLKGEQIPVISPDGTAGTIPAENAHAAFKAGYQLEPLAAQHDRFEQETYGEGALNEAKAFAAGAARGATLGLSDQLLTKTGLVEPETLEGLDKHNPGASMAGNVAGILAPALLTGGASAAAEGGAAAASTAARAAEFLPSTLTAKLGAAVSERVAQGVGSEAAQSLAGRIVQAAVPKVAGSAIEGAVYGVGNSLTEDALGDPDALSEKLLSTVGLGALIGAGVGAAAGGLEVSKPYVDRALAKGTDLAKEGAEKVFESYLGLPKGTVKEYLEKHAAVNAAPEFQDVFDSAAAHVQGVMDDLSSRKMSELEAKHAYESYAKDLNADFKQRGFDAKQSRDLTAQALKYAHQQAAEGLEKNVVATAEPISQAIEGLRQKVIDASSGAFELLESKGQTIPLDGLQRQIGKLAAEVRKEGTDQAQAIAAKLESYGQNIREQFSEVIERPTYKREPITGKMIESGKELVTVAREARPEEMKKLIQGLDKITAWNPNLTAFDDAANKSFKQLRYSLDDELKSLFDDYRKAMEPIAEESKLLRKLEAYGTPEKAASRLKSIHLPDRVQSELPLLRKLEEKSGLKFLDAVETYASSEKTEALYRALPEAKAAAEAQKAYEFFQNPESKAKLEEMIRASDEAKLFQNATAATEYAGKQKDALGGLTPANLQGKLNKAMRGSDINAARAIEGLPDFEGKSIPELLDSIRIKKAFEGDATRGSKHVNLYAATVGGLFGGIQGAGLGAAAGAMVDKYGPQMAKKLLDTYIKLSNIETMNGRMTQQIVSNVRSFVAHAGADVANTRQVAQAASVNYLNRYRLDEAKPDRSKKDRLHYFHRRYDEVAQAVSNPEALSDRIGKNLQGLGSVAPKTTQALTTSAIRATQFLYAKAPKDPNAAYALNPALRKWRPSDAEISKWERYVAAVDHPMSVLHDLKHNVVTLEGVETLKSVYPKLYQEAVGTLVDHLSELKHELPYKKRLTLSTFMGVPIDAATDPKFIAKMQALHGEAAAQAQGQGQGGGGKVSLAGASKMRMAHGAQTETERVMYRG